MIATKQPHQFARTVVALAVQTALGMAVTQQAAFAAEDYQGLETIVVTAQKRTEKLQEVPIPVTVFDAAALEKTAAVDMRDIANLTPGFTMTQFNIGEPSYSLRGISSSSDSAAGDASVAVFVDEVFIGRPAGANFSFLDLERIEVLRGPQGTLFGRNTAGGALSVTTAAPSRKFSSKVFASYGNYNTVETGAVINGPVNDVVSAKFSVGYREHDGYSKNINTGAQLDGGRSSSARLQFKINASDATSILLSADTASDRALSPARVPYPVLSTVGPNAQVRTYYPEDTDLRRSPSNPAAYQNRDVFGFSARIEHDMNFSTLTSITAYRKTELNQWEDLGYKPVLINDDRVRESAEQWSQEFRLASPSGGKFNWVTGLYLFSESVNRDESFYTRYTLLPIAGGDVLFNQNAKNKSAAVFGQVDFALTQQLNLSAGVRKTRDIKNADQAAFNLDPTDATPGIPLFPGQPYHVVGGKTWDAMTGKLGLDYRIDPSKMVYASASRGYKSGMFPSQNNTVQSVGTPLEPEKIRNYEIGAKTEWLDRRLRVNATAFTMDYKDLQQYNLTPQLLLLTYSLDAKVKGAEIEVLTAPTDWLMLGGTFSRLETEITRGAFNGASLIGKELTRAPHKTYTVFAELTKPLAGGKLNARIEYAHKDRYFVDTTNSVAATFPAYGVVDGRISYTVPGGDLEFSLWGKNLTDKIYQQHVIVFQGNGVSTFAPPRTYGVSMKWKFG